jgi:hypothetical protein
MNIKDNSFMKRAFIIFVTLLTIASALVLYAYRGTRGKTDIEFRIHINEQLIQESTYGESPTFAIWLEDPDTGTRQTVFVTRRAASGDWEGKAAVPVALPLWYEIYKMEHETTDIPNFENPAPIAVTGATPKPGYFKTRARVDTGSKWICWIEVNLSGDYNTTYKEYDQINQVEDEYGTGQPAVVFRTEMSAIEGTIIVPEIAGMCIQKAADGNILQPLKGITTARNIFDEISIALVKPNPKIIAN